MPAPEGLSFMVTQNGQLISLLVRAACTSVIGLDVRGALTQICADLPEAADAAGAVIMVSGLSRSCTSGPPAQLLGDAQSAAGNGPLPHVMRTGMPLFTPDLTWVGPPALAAAAADVGLVSSAAVPLRAQRSGAVLGGLQVLGSTERPVDGSHLDLLRPLADVLATMLDDAATHQRVLASTGGPAEQTARVPLPQPRSTEESAARHRRVQ